MPQMEKGLVVNHQQVGPDLYELDFIAPATARECQPGQFIHVLPGYTHDPLLRRPLSIYDVDSERGIISFLYRVVGKGTELLTGVKNNDYLDIMGPLGKGFTLPDQTANVILVGGGVGMAPLLFLGRSLRDRNCRVTALYGAGGAEQLGAVKRFEGLGIDCLTATMDGSSGHRGLVTELLDTGLRGEQVDFIYACGPEAMMAVAADWAMSHSIEGEVSLEEHMACGVGACLGCARRLKNSDEGYVKVCKDGPVFDIKAIELYKNLG